MSKLIEAQKPYDVFGVELKGKGGTAVLRGRWDPSSMVLDIEDPMYVGEIRRARGGEKAATLKVGTQFFDVLSAKPMPPTSAHVARIFTAPAAAKAPAQAPARPKNGLKESPDFSESISSVQSLLADIRKSKRIAEDMAPQIPPEEAKARVKAVVDKVGIKVLKWASYGSIDTPFTKQELLNLIYKKAVGEKTTFDSILSTAEKRHQFLIDAGNHMPSFETTSQTEYQAAALVCCKRNLTDPGSLPISKRTFNDIRFDLKKFQTEVEKQAILNNLKPVKVKIIASPERG